MKKQKESKNIKLSWKKSFMQGILMVPVATVFFFLIIEFLPSEFGNNAKQIVFGFPMIFVLVFYALGVIATRLMGLDLTNKEDWPDLP